MVNFSNNRLYFPLIIWHSLKYCRNKIEVMGDAAHTTKFSIVDGYDAEISTLCVLDANCFNKMRAGFCGMLIPWCSTRTIFFSFLQMLEIEPNGYAEPRWHCPKHMLICLFFFSSFAWHSSWRNSMWTDYYIYKSMINDIY